MVDNKKEEDEHPHFVNETYPKNTPWLTNIYFGQRDGSGSHAHVTLSGSVILYLRNPQGNEIIKNGEIARSISQ